MIEFPPSRSAACARLTAFVPRAGRAYAEGRNAEVPGHSAVSTLSPYLRHRALTEAEVARAVNDQHGPHAASFLSEILWRSYFKGWLERRPGIWSAYQQGLHAARNRIGTEAGLRITWQEACEGRTGIAPFDHWAAELRSTGYLHNHARMWFASIWMHSLRLPWELGADFFLRHLLDGDPASNTLSWRWVGGLHTRGKTYLARPDNIARHTGGRWNAEDLTAQLARTAAPLDGPPHPAPGPVPRDGSWDPSLRTGLLLTEDDLHPDFFFARGLIPAAGAVLIAPEGRSPLTVADPVQRFTRTLAMDAATRLAEHCPTAPVTDDVNTILDWTRAERLQQLVVPYAPTGPAATKLVTLAAGLDIPMVRPLRAWDAAVWPHATAGFFKVKARMQTILEAAPQDLAR